MSNIDFGFHIAKDKTFLKTYENINEFQFSASQIYVSNSRSYNPPKPVLVDLLQTRKYLERKDHSPFIHGKLLYNLAGCVDGKTNPKFKSMLHIIKEGLAAELDVASMLGGAVVVHIGSCKDKSAGIDTIVDTIFKTLTIDSIFADDFKSSKIDVKSDRKLLLENAAGEGNKIGSTLDEISLILSKFDAKCEIEHRPELKNNLGVCIDTAHIHGAGFYDLSKRNTVVKFFEDLEKKDILNRLELIHFNDSKVELGSKKDRHAPIGEGKIWSDTNSMGASAEALKEFMTITNDYSIKMIGEPNDSREEDSSKKYSSEVDSIDILFPGYNIIQKNIDEINKDETFRC